MVVNFEAYNVRYGSMGDKEKLIAVGNMTVEQLPMVGDFFVFRGDKPGWINITGPTTDEAKTATEWQEILDEKWDSSLRDNDFRVHRREYSTNRLTIIIKMV